MSRLHDPGPGEILDRLTILALKLVYGKQVGKATVHWEQEREALRSALEKTCAVGCAGQGRVLELAAVNAALWQAEDELRYLRRGYDGGTTVGVLELAAAGIRIQQLNDRRAELITLINTNAGVQRPSDKV